MNTIASLIRRNPALAEQAVEDLADLFRASLQDTQKPGSLGDEIALCKRYLRIEQHRLGNRLHVAWQLDTIPMDINLPALSIQPLLENAIYHGIEPAPEGGNINIYGSCNEQHVTIVIENPLYLDRDIHGRRTGNQFAQENVRQRLASRFKKDNLLRVEQINNIYKATLTIPRLP